MTSRVDDVIFQFLRLFPVVSYGCWKIPVYCGMVVVVVVAGDDDIQVPKVNLSRQSDSVVYIASWNELSWAGVCLSPHQMLLTWYFIL